MLPRGRKAGYNLLNIEDPKYLMLINVALKKTISPTT